MDEIIISFDGRSVQKVTIPAKPIPVGFKLQGLGDRGYMYSWEATRPKLAEFHQGTAKFSVPIPGTTPPVLAFLTATQSMVARLVESLPKGRRFHLYLDNLFVCWRLCQYLKIRDIAVTGPCRKGACGYPPRLLALKGVPTSLNWGALQSTNVKEVNTWLWQDNNLVMGIFFPFLFSLLFSYFLFFFRPISNHHKLGMTTGHLPTEEITRNRRRPKKTSTNSTIAREVFDGQHRKELEIPFFIDCYNHYMNSVDVANQLRATATVHFSRNEKEFFPGMF